MGCDIHYTIEKRNQFTKENETRKYTTAWVDGNHYRYDTITNKLIMLKDLHITNDYDLFAQLADVRNDNSYPFIAEPRDIPDDAIDVTLEKLELEEMDAHSMSYVTLNELIAHFKKYPTIKDEDNKEVVNHTIFNLILDLIKNQRESDIDFVLARMDNPSLYNNMQIINANMYAKKPNLVYQQEMQLKNALNQDIDDKANLKMAQDLAKNYQTEPAGDDIRLVFWFDN